MLPMMYRTVSPARIGRRVAVALALVVGAAGSAAGQTEYHWNPPAGGAGSWDLSTANWSTNPAGPLNYTWVNSGSERANFGGTGGAVALAAGGITAFGLNFTATNYALSGGPLTLAGTGGPVAVPNAADVATISTVVAGSVGLTKTGAGTLVLSGANTYLGRTTVSAGILSVTSSSALGLGGGLNDTRVSEGATLQVSGGIQIQDGLVLNGTGVGGGGALRSTGGNNVFFSPVTGGTARINVDAGTLGFLSAVGGSSLTLGGAGNVVITGSGGSLDGGNVIVEGTGNTAVSGPSISLTGTLTHNSTGTLRLQPLTSGSVSGGIVITAGTVLVNANPGLPFFTAGSVTVNSGGTLGGTGTMIGTGSFTATVSPGGTIRGGAAGTIGTLTLGGNLTLGATSGSAAKLQVTADTTTASKVQVGGTVNFSRPSEADPLVIEIQSPGLTGGTSYTRTIATASGGFLRNGAGPLPTGTVFVLGTDYVLTSPDFASFTSATLQIQTGNALVLQFVPVPESGMVFGIVAGVGVIGRLAARRGRARRSEASAANR
jgi:fibronectin-binding autotransporter adhesin